MVSLTQQEEAQLIENYSKIAWKLVHRFAGGRGSSIFSREDLYQECMLVLIKYIKRCEYRDELCAFHPMNFVNAMTRFVLKNQVVRIDHNRTNQTKRMIETCPRKAEFEKAFEVQYGGSDSIDDLIEKISMEQFLETARLRPMEKTALEQRLKGFDVTEIARICDKPHQTVSYALKSAKRKYDEFVA